MRSKNLRDGARRQQNENANVVQMEPDWLNGKSSVHLFCQTFKRFLGSTEFFSFAYDYGRLWTASRGALTEGTWEWPVMTGRNLGTCRAVTNFQTTWRTTQFKSCKRNIGVSFEMYGGPRRPNSSPFQGRSRALPQNFRPQFQNPGFPPPRHDVYPSQFGDFRPRQPYQQTQGPFSMNPRFQGPFEGFQPRAWRGHGPRQSFRPTGFQEQQRHRVNL